MTSIRFSLLVAFAAIAMALLSVFGIVPVWVAQYVPLIAVPFIIGYGRRGCAGRAC